MKKKYFAALLLPLLLLTGCSEAVSGLPSGKFKAAIVENGSEPGEVLSVRQSLIDNIAENLGLEAELVQCPDSEAVLAAVRSGGADVGFPCLAVSSAVGTEFLLSVPYLSVNVVSVSVSANGFDEETQDIALTGIAENLASLDSLGRYGECAVFSAESSVEALKNGTITGFLCLKYDAAELLELLPEAKADVLRTIEITDFSALIRKNNGKMKETVDATIYGG